MQEMTKKRSLAQQKEDHESDQFIARCAWVVLCTALIGVVIYVISSHDTLSGLLLALFFPAVTGAIAYIFSPGDKQILRHLAKEWRLAAWLFGTTLIGFSAYFGYLAITDDPTPPPSEHVVKIGVDLPLTGTDNADGIAILNGINLALEGNGPLDGYRIVAVPKSNDNSITKVNDPDVGVSNIKAFLKDGEVAGIIGPYNSGVALKEIPIINGENDEQRKIALISPSATADCLTTTSYPTPDCNDVNRQGAFFRLSSLNGKDGEVFANCLSFPSGGAGDLCPGSSFHKYRNVVIIEDSSPYSVGFAASFRKHWELKGGTKAATKTVSTKASPASLRQAVQSAIQELGTTPDLVFFAGSEENARALHTVMQQSPSVSQGLSANLSRTAFASGASIMNPVFVKHLKEQTQKAPIFASAPIKNVDTPDTHDQRSARDFIELYQKKYKIKPTPYAAAGYDATKILIQAMQEAAGKSGIPNPSDKAAVQEFRDKIIYSLKNPIDNAVTGVTGRYSFDENGDYRDASVSVFEWNPSNPYNQNGWESR